MADETDEQVVLDSYFNAATALARLWTRLPDQYGDENETVIDYLTNNKIVLTGDVARDFKRAFHGCPAEIQSLQNRGPAEPKVESSAADLVQRLVA